MRRGRVYSALVLGGFLVALATGNVHSAFYLALRLV